MVVKIAAHRRIELRIRAADGMTCVGKCDGNGCHCRTSDTEKIEGTHRWLDCLFLVTVLHLQHAGWLIDT